MRRGQPRSVVKCLVVQLSSRPCIPAVRNARRCATRTTRSLSDCLSLRLDVAARVGTPLGAPCMTADKRCCLFAKVAAVYSFVKRHIVQLHNTRDSHVYSLPGKRSTLAFLGVRLFFLTAVTRCRLLILRELVKCGIGGEESPSIGCASMAWYNFGVFLICLAV